MCNDDINEIIKNIRENQDQLENKAKNFDYIDKFFKDNPRIKQYMNKTKIDKIDEPINKIYTIAISRMLSELDANRNTLRNFSEYCEKDPRIKPYLDEARKTTIGGISSIYYNMIKLILDNKLDDKKAKTSDILELKQLKTGYRVTNNYDWENRKFPIKTIISSLDGSYKITFLNKEDDVVFMETAKGVECFINRRNE